MNLNKKSERVINKPPTLKRENVVFEQRKKTTSPEEKSVKIFREKNTNFNLCFQKIGKMEGQPQDGAGAAPPGRA